MSAAIEAAKLLRELEKEAMDRVVGHYSTPADNVLRGSAVGMRDVFGKVVIHVRATFNGVSIEAKADADEFTADRAWQAIRDAIRSQVVAAFEDMALHETAKALAPSFAKRAKGEG